MKLSLKEFFLHEEESSSTAKSSINITVHSSAQVNIKEHQDPSCRDPEKGRSAWSDPNTPARAIKFSSSEGQLDVDISEAPEEPGDDQWGFDDPEYGKGQDFGTAPPRDPAWDLTARGMSWDEFKQKHPAEASELEQSVLDNEPIKQGDFRVRTAPRNKFGDAEKSDFFSVTLPDKRKLSFMGPGLGWKQLDANEPVEDEPEYGPELDEPVDWRKL